MVKQQNQKVCVIPNYNNICLQGCLDHQHISIFSCMFHLYVVIDKFFAKVYLENLAYVDLAKIPPL